MSKTSRSPYIAYFAMVACLLLNGHVGNVLPSLVVLVVGGLSLFAEFTPDGDAGRRSAAVEMIGAALIATVLFAFFAVDVVSFAVTFSAIALVHMAADIVRTMWRRWRAGTARDGAAPEPA